MKTFKAFVRRFVRQTHAQDLIEFGLLAGIVTAATVVAIEQIGVKVTGIYNDNVSEIIASGGGGADPNLPPANNGNGNGNGNGNNGNGTGNNGNGNGNNGNNGTGNGNTPP